MKKISFLIFALLIQVISYSQGSSQVGVNLNLSEVLQISTSAGQEIVNIPFTTAAHYVQGNSFSATNQLVITATTEYQVTVQASQDFTNGGETIPVDKLKLSLSNGTGGNSTPSYATDMPMSTAIAQQVLATDSGDMQRKVNVNYFVEPGPWLLDVSPGIYSTTLTYTIIAL